MKRRSVRGVLSVTLPTDSFGSLVAPARAWSYPAVRLVRLHLEPGAVDWTSEALDAAVNIVGDADVMVESDNPVLASQFLAALKLRLHELDHVNEVDPPPDYAA